MSDPQTEPCPTTDGDNLAWDLLFDWGMTSIPTGTPVKPGAARVPIEPMRTRTGQTIIIGAVFPNEWQVQGPLIVRDGSRVIVGHDDGYITFNITEAVTVAVYYIDPPEATS